MRPCPPETPAPGKFVLHMPGQPSAPRTRPMDCRKFPAEYRRCPLPPPKSTPAQWCALPLSPYPAPSVSALSFFSIIYPPCNVKRGRKSNQTHPCVLPPWTLWEILSAFHRKFCALFPTASSFLSHHLIVSKTPAKAKTALAGVQPLPFSSLGESGMNSNMQRLPFTVLAISQQSGNLWCND